MENHSEQEVIVSTEETVTLIVVEPVVEPVVVPVVVPVEEPVVVPVVVPVVEPVVVPVVVPLVVPLVVPVVEPVVVPVVVPVVEPVVEIKHVTFNPSENKEIIIELQENQDTITAINKPIIKNEPPQNARFGFSFNKMIKPVRNKLSKLNFF